MPPRSIRRPARCWRWPSGSANRPAPASATSAKRPTRVGAQLVGALPGAGGLNAGADARRGRCKALLLLNIEPALDAADAAAARAALAGADLVVALTLVQGRGLDGADVLLPIAPFTETAGTFVNAEGRVQSFHGVVKPLGDTRPAWKVLRVLGNLLGLPGFDYESAEDVRAAALGDGRRRARLDNRRHCRAGSRARRRAGLERVADVPIYATDALVRRAASLQLTADARAPVVGLSAALWQQLGLHDGDQVRVSQGSAQAVLPARAMRRWLPARCVWPPAIADTAALGAMFGAIAVEKA